MKLEIKHIAPYLPYRLKMTKEDWGKTGILVPWIMTLEKGLQIELDYAITTQAKPILRPLSDIMIHMAYIMPLINAHSKNLEIEVEQISDMFPAIMSNYNIASKLFEFHYDVFGLIEKGLAINLNDIK